MLITASRIIPVVVILGACSSDVTREVRCAYPVAFPDATRRVEIDLNCDASLDTLQLSESEDSAGVYRRWLTIHGVSIDLRAEASTELVAVADLNGDGLDDVLIAATDVGVVFPVVVISTASGGRIADFETLEAARAANFLFAEDDQDRCLRASRPSIVDLGGGFGVSIVYGNVGEPDCGSDLQRTTFLVQNGRLSPVS